MTPERLASATEIARIPEEIRGYGHVKERQVGGADGAVEGRCLI